MTPTTGHKGARLIKAWPTTRSLPEVAAQAEIVGSAIAQSPNEYATNKLLPETAVHEYTNIVGSPNESKLLPEDGHAKNVGSPNEPEIHTRASKRITQVFKMCDKVSQRKSSIGNAKSSFPNAKNTN